jgi:polyisoprenoid-binding protein YceI
MSGTVAAAEEGDMMATQQTALPTWTLDPVHSSIEFSLEFMGMSTYRTGFRALEGTLRFDPDRPAESSVSATIPVASVDVTNDRLMGRLMEDDLLGGANHPSITFRSTRVDVVSPESWKISGELTIHGTSRPVTLIARYFGQKKSPFSGKMMATFRAETIVNRGDFGVTWNAPLEAGGTYLGERVHLSLLIVAARQD